MTHLTALQCSMRADGALVDAESESVETHLNACEACRARVAQLESESSVLRRSLRDVPEADVVIPPFRAPGRLRQFAIANVVAGCVIWLIQFLWKTLFGEVVVDVATRVTETYLPDTYEMGVSAALYLLREGTVMLNAYLGYVVAGVLLATILWLGFAFRRLRGTLGMGLILITAASTVVPVPGHALEIRRTDGVVTVAAGEVIDDTLVVMADTSLIEGTIHGDLIAAGRRIDINGDVHGNVLALGDSVTIRGAVSGSVLSAGASVELDGAQIAGDLWGTGDRVTIGSDARITRNATVGTETATIDGSVGGDVTAFAQIVEVSGAIGDDLEAYAERVHLLDGAAIEGDLRFRSGDEHDLERAPTATVGGAVELLELPMGRNSGNRYANARFYAWQLARLVAAFLAGWAVLWLIPGLRCEVVAGAVDGLKRTGIGLITLIGLPIVVVVTAVTLVGLPFALVGLVSWVAMLYLAKILVAALLGKFLLASTARRDSLPLTLLAGLVPIIVVVNLPAIGGIVSVVLTLLGSGLIVQWAMIGWARRSWRSAV